MKSEKAKEYITHATCTAQEYAERFGGRELVVSRWDVSTAIELAEQEAEERMREKAIEAHRKVCFFRNPKDNTCANTATKCGEHSCYYMNYFIQKTDRE